MCIDRMCRRVRLHVLARPRQGSPRASSQSIFITNRWAKVLVSARWSSATLPGAGDSEDSRSVPHSGSS